MVLIAKALHGGASTNGGDSVIVDGNHDRECEVPLLRTQEGISRPLPIAKTTRHYRWRSFIRGYWKLF